MKILYDHQIFLLQKFGGISRYYNEIMKIKNQGFEVASIDPELFIPPVIEKKEIKHDLLSKGSRYLKRKLLGPPSALPEIEAPAFPAEAAAIFLQSDYDLFHPTYYDPYFLAFNNKPFVVTVYDMIHEIYKEYFIVEDPTSYNKLQLCQKAQQVITISEKTKEDLIQIFNIPEEKVHAIPLASAFNEVIPRKPEHIEGLERYMLFVGNRGIYKNFYFPIIALTETLKNDHHLQVLCTGHPFSKWELQFFMEQGIDGQMKHIYLHDDNELAWVYQHAALFFFPSLYEGFGFPILEAFASNCPVISSTGGSLPEVAGDAVLYFEPRNYLQIQEAANTVLYNSQLRNELIHKGQERFSLFSWDACREKTIEVYQKALH